ncbi:MAG: 50S ribosomal protein L18 [Nanoarchaeota archaeon]
MKQRPYSPPFKRKRLGKTDYRARLKLLTGKMLRLVIRKSLKNIRAQIIEFHATGDHVLVSVSTKDLQKKYGWPAARRNTPAAYLTGYLLGLKAKGKKITGAIVDIGLQTAGKGSILFAVVKGAIDAGMKIPYNPINFPSEERIKGKHIKFKNLNVDQIKQAIDRTFQEKP